MSPRRITADRSRRDSGYALLLVLFLSAAMLLLAAVATPRLLTQGRRDKEEEMIWRGGQYARAVRLFYRKNGRFPQSLEDLTQAKNGLRYLRQPYKDPMNSEDGSWRLLHIGPGGQIIGSVKQRSVLQSLGQQAGQPAPQKPTLPLGDSSDAGPPAAVDAPGTPAGTTTPQPAPAQPDTVEGKLFGGNIIGVGSKINRPSIRIFDGGTTYREWEFIWDPTKEALGGAGLGVLGPAPGATPDANTPSPVPRPRRLR
jgi:type II secretory pathway pseudopilin PulG